MDQTFIKGPLAEGVIRTTHTTYIYFREKDRF